MSWLDVLVGLGGFAIGGIVFAKHTGARDPRCVGAHGHEAHLYGSRCKAYRWPVCDDGRCKAHCRANCKCEVP